MARKLSKAQQLNLKFQNELRLKEEQALKKGYQNLKMMSSGIKKTEGVKGRRESYSLPNHRSIDDKTKHRSVIGHEMATGTSINKPDYEGEMLERERLAQEEIAHKKTCVAPHYSKGPYQYVTEGIDPSNIGRKL